MTFDLKLREDLSLATHHILVSGVSGTGKSDFLTLLMMHILKDVCENTSISPDDRYKYLRVIDPKAGSLYAIRRLIRNDLGHRTFASTPEQALKLLEETYQLTKQRMALFDDVSLAMGSDWQTLKLQPIYIIIDELVDLCENAKAIDPKLFKRITSVIVQLTTIGRQAGVFLVLSVMKPQFEYLPTMVRSILLSVILGDETKPVDSESMRQMFGTSDVERPPVGTRYYGYARGEGAGKPTLFLTPHWSPNIEPMTVFRKYLSGL